ncbi:MAG: hypothetical protein KAU01_00230 [Candidatus Cloacimonetes bacterium]|nr:hypothetical protein [Candidatus Cloacimonadota bacterium]
MLQIDKSLILDLSILIDFYSISKEIFKFVDDLSITMNVSDVTFQKFDQVNETELEKLHIKIIETPIEMLIEAANRGKSSLAFDDYVSFLHAKENNFILSTNDKTLKTYAQSKNVDTLWGLEIILFLESNNKISKEKAKELFKKLRIVNNRITDDIEKEFLKLLYQ